MSFRSLTDDQPRAFRDADGHLLDPLPPEPVEQVESHAAQLLRVIKDDALAYKQLLAQQVNENKINMGLVEKAFAQQDTLNETPTPDEEYATKTWIDGGVKMKCSSCSNTWSRAIGGLHKSRCPKCKSYSVGPFIWPNHAEGCSCSLCSDLNGTAIVGKDGVVVAGGILSPESGSLAVKVGDVVPLPFDHKAFEIDKTDIYTTSLGGGTTHLGHYDPAGFWNPAHPLDDCYCEECVKPQPPETAAAVGETSLGSAFGGPYSPYPDLF